MAKCTYVDLLPEDYDLYYGSLAPGDRFMHARIKRKTAFFSRWRKLDLGGRSLFKVLSEYWQAFNQTQKDAWNAVGAVIGLNGWQAFVEDTAARWRFDYSGTSTPNLLHNARVGKLVIASPATEIKIAQYHPQWYYIRKKVRGRKGMYEPYKIEEYLGLPLELKLSYKANLVSAGAGSFAKYYARIHHLYQGLDLYTNHELSLDFITAWKSADATISEVIGTAVNYDLYIHLYNVTGSLWIDNVECNHSAQNWVRDWDCDDINKVFTRAFYQVPMTWAPITVPEGAEYESIFETY